MVVSTKEKVSHDFAFGGPWGALAIQIALPIFTFGVVIWGKQISVNTNTDALALFSFRSFLVGGFWIIVWFLFLSILYLLPLGPLLKGLPLRNGQRLEYRCNAFISLVITVIVGTFCYFATGLPLDRLYENISGFAAASILYCCVLSTYFYLKSFRCTETELAEHGTSGYLSYDFFMGRELNPREGRFDWKFFCELRPGLIGWVLLEVSMLIWEFKNYGSLSPPLILLTFFHMWYVADALWQEPTLLSMKDIIEEGFGFMLVFGDLAFVPFFYASQAMYVLAARPVIPYWTLAFSIVLHVIGYTIFRQSNLQKNWFRNDPTDPRVRHFDTISTGVAGKNLLCGGWWSVVRHPNYLGDLLMAVAWTSLCGLDSVYPFLYCGYFFTLLLHREIRDEQVCHDKYGKAWERFQAKVPYRIFPFIF